MFTFIGVNKNDFFIGCYISEEQTDGLLIAVNEKFLAMSLKENGNILVVDSSKPKYILSKLPLILKEIIQLF